MRIVRVKYQNQTFYAKLNSDNTVQSLNPGLGFGQPIPLSNTALMPVVWPTKIICVGMNYANHAKELDLKTPEEPLIFFKPPSAIVGPGQAIVLPTDSQRVDYEAELAIVLGQGCRNVEPEEASPYIFGYTCANDVTERVIQKKDGLYARAKGFDTFLPIGPWIETTVSDPTNLGVRTLVNGELRQEGNTADMIFSPNKLISFISKVMTLLPGDVILTGTPAGIGQINHGDEVRVEIDQIGVLINKVVAEEKVKDSDPEEIDLIQ